MYLTRKNGSHDGEAFEEITFGGSALVILLEARYIGDFSTVYLGR